MISISIYRNAKKNIEQFIVKGHAYAADPGQDIVCAAVSVLSQTTVLALHEIAHVAIEYEIENGYLKCKLPMNLMEKELYETKLLIDTMLLGLNNIRESYPQYVEIHDKEV
ncbi:ribosomal-processing cysteine protease Prp [Alkaliphilus sp. MSJ-5]|uniref:Ribosomal-processing cysteine protease Prp n=1 Tax=Alkaliphilus flagellatus TaxID=2841507 RepID=A0ABS6G5R6_9FIRM|nr:ribosomal-processing cysteine protease Prp [Alkaliphilus flagellatus]MBU5677714.1 ribosomal-processing cysteine protease Prp [Alkaliphilus flagellatus]